MKFGLSANIGKLASRIPETARRIEALGFESGVNRRFGEAPIFYWLFTGLIVVGGGVILIPGFPLVRMILFSQVINGILLPFILIFMTMLVNKPRVMKEWVNSRFRRC